MYVDEPPKDGNIPDFNISKIDICPFRAYQRSFRLFQGDFSTDIHQRSRLLCFTQNDHTGQTGFKICSFLKWAHNYSFASYLNILTRKRLYTRSFLKDSGNRSERNWKTGAPAGDTRYFTSCLNFTFRLWLAKVRFVASLPEPIYTAFSS